MNYAADDFEAIRRREEEIKAERDLVLTGSSVPTGGIVIDPQTVWTFPAAYDYDSA